MKKRFKDYYDKFGHIDCDFLTRFHALKDSLNLSKKDLQKLKDAVDRLQHRKWNKLDFTFYMMPKATARPRTTSFHKKFYVKDASENNQIFSDFIKECNDVKFAITTPTKVCTDIFMPMPSGMNKIEKLCAELKLLYFISRPDWDNLGKTYSDMIQGYFLIDDSLIVDGRVRKFYSTKPRIEVHLEFMDQYDCKFNKRKVELWGCYLNCKNSIYERDSLI